MVVGNLVGIVVVEVVGGWLYGEREWGWRYVRTLPPKEGEKYLKIVVVVVVVVVVVIVVLVVLGVVVVCGG